ncbi:flagellar motor switch protein FliN/FliY [Treponema berlinense]|uniref:Flagellar motor switch protein FliN n=1 Tax=Treponema berlinense TaxID=225004 RepID=A0A1T4KGW5_9SPIR|nr:flagellar motor switch protein FliN [Treponema berlinense]SJZ41641.1 flagellar motor switch protein FliN/FliY [Treponema berlinense]
MSDGAISQDEIDALLSGVDMGGITGGNSSSVNIDTSVLEKFADGIKDELKTKLNSMTGSEFSVETPSVEILERDQLLAKLPEMVVAVMADFTTALKGDHLFILSTEFAQKLTSLINKEEQAELDDMALSVISEVVSNHSGTEITELSKDGKLPGLAANPPEAVNVPKAMVRIPQGKFCLFTYTYSVDSQNYVLWEAVSSSVAEEMVKALGGGTSANVDNAAVSSAQNTQNMGMGMQQPMGGAMPNMGMGMGMQQPMGAMPNMGMGMQQPMGAMPNMGMGMGMQQPMGQVSGMNTPNVQSIQFPNLMGGSASTEQGNIGLIMDVFMEMTVELGRTKKQIKEILGMGEGTIIELDKLAGEPVDILVNHKPIAKGEVVVIDENFGVRVTEILSPMERVSDIR